MQYYSYSTSFYRFQNRKIIVLNESGKEAFEVKQKRVSLKAILRILFDIKFTYFVQQAGVKEKLYLIGGYFSLYLKVLNSKKKIKIKTKRIQLLEKIWLFTLKDEKYSFEVDVRRKGILKRNDEIVSTAQIINLFQEEDDEIRIEAIDANIAALCLVCYQSFHMAKYETNFTTY